MKINLLFLLMFLFAKAIVFGQSVPSLINYQGQLADQAGAYGFQFRIWDDPTSTTSSHFIWGQSQSVTVLANGVFNVLLGSPGGTNIPGAAVNDLRFAFTGTTRLLGVTIISRASVAVSTPTEILPRQQLMIVPYSMVAQSVDPGSIVTASFAPGAVGSAALADAAVQLGNIANGAVGTAQIANASVGVSQLPPGAVGFIARGIQIFTSSGVWTRPPNISTVYVKLWGGGGAGGDGGGGGGGGGYCEGIVSVTTDIVVTVGKGGIPDHSGGYPGNGGDSIFPANPVLRSYGGGGGQSIGVTGGTSTGTEGSSGHAYGGGGGGGSVVNIGRGGIIYGASGTDGAIILYY